MPYNILLGLYQTEIKKKLNEYKRSLAFKLGFADNQKYLNQMKQMDLPFLIKLGYKLGGVYGSLATSIDRLNHIIVRDYQSRDIRNDYYLLKDYYLQLMNSLFLKGIFHELELLDKRELEKREGINNKSDYKKEVY